ncbi:hypothetical protein N7492_005499 [Penicillium capsulatum]|uniref:Uncharacterized protein n=1 Tax=Penicillium capsulatum TaxID=69766 RepID=A0A9W9ICL2_9EURO|nr:hypothetical protein N7492_005499 [Penicillium capsulatum]KAJ6135400.1 hypothetical protein N7512_000560 [Penicillium capsulatum]
MSRQNLNPRSLQSRISHLIAHWPSDAVRPVAVSVPAYLQARLAQSPANATSQEPNTLTSKPNISESSVNALTALLENRFIKTYPMSPEIRFPASNPEHYDNVVHEFEEAPNRHWLGRLGKRLGGLFRMQ